MKHSIIQKAGVCLLAFLCITISLSLYLSLPLRAAETAQPVSEKMVTLEASQDITLTIWFDTELPGVTFTAPDGSQLPLSESTAGINLLVDEKWALVQIPSAAAGDWYIQIDPRSNSEVSYQLMGMTENLWIQYITADPQASGRVNVAFMAELGEERTSYRYELCLSADYEQAGEVTLREGSAITGTEESLTLDLTDYASYEGYVLVLYVYKSTDEVELFDSLSSEPFNYVNPNSLQAPAGIDVQVNLSNRVLTADWSAYTHYRYDSYFVSISAPGLEEPIYYSAFESDETMFTQYLEAQYNQLTLTFYGRQDNRLSEPVIREIQLDDKPIITILTPSPTASSQAQIQMKLPDQTVMSIAVGETEYQFTSDGNENTVAVDLVNGNNTLTASAIVNDVEYYLSEDIYKDGFPPVLAFFEPYDGQKFTDASLKIVGNVSDAVSLYLGDQEIALDEYGNFTAEIELAVGENELTFVAEDNAGNRTTRTLYLYGDETITAAGKLATFTQNYLPLIIAGAVSLAVIILSIVLLIRKKKLKGFSFASLIVFFSLTTAGTLAMLIWQIIHRVQLENTAHSMAFSELVSRSLEEAYALLTDLETAPDRIWLWVWLTAGSAGLLILTILIRLIVKKIQARKAKPQSPTPPKAPKAPKAPKTPKPPKVSKVSKVSVNSQPISPAPPPEQTAPQDPTVPKAKVSNSAETPAASTQSSQTDAGKTQDMLTESAGAANIDATAKSNKPIESGASNDIVPPVDPPTEL